MRSSRPQAGSAKKMRSSSRLAAARTGEAGDAALGPVHRVLRHMGGGGAAEVEAADRFAEVGCAALPVRRGGVGLLDHGGVLLGDLVHVVDRGVDLAETDGLLAGRAGDVGDDLVD